MDVAEARQLDELAAAAIVAPMHADVAGWSCKAAPDLPFRRANAVLPPADAGADRLAFAAGLAAVRRWYRDLGQRLIVQVSTANRHHAALDRWLADDGLQVEAPVHVMVRASAAVAPSTSGRVHAAVAVGVDEAWATEVARSMHGAGDGTSGRTKAYGRMLDVLGDRALGATVHRAGEVVGAGFGVVDPPWVGIFGMATAPEHRREGIATAVVGALLDVAAEHGARRAYLQVETDNVGAIALYQAIGFTQHHDYHYRSES